MAPRLSPEYYRSPVPAYGQGAPNPSNFGVPSYLAGGPVPSMIPSAPPPMPSMEGFGGFSAESFPQDPQAVLALQAALRNWQLAQAGFGANSKRARSAADLALARLGTDQPQDLARAGEALAERGVFSSGIRKQDYRNIRTDYSRQRQDIATQLANALSDLSLNRQGAQNSFLDTKSQAALANAHYAAGNPPSSFQVAPAGSAPNWGANGFGPAGAPYAAALFAAASKQFPGLSNIGEYANRNIRGTNILSTHALGNAIDIGLPRGPNGQYNQAEGLKLYNWLAKNQSAFGIQHILYDPAGAHGANPGDHVNHIHVDWGYSPWAGWNGSLTTGTSGPTISAVSPAFGASPPSYGSSAYSGPFDQPTYGSGGGSRSSGSSYSPTGGGGGGGRRVR